MTLPRKLWLLLTLFIVYGGTIPFRFTADPVLVREKFSRVTLDVRISPDTGGRISRADFVQNVLLFVPFGVLGVLADRRTAGSGAARIAVVSAFGLILATTLECLQLFTVDRTASLTDVLANTAGALLGAVAVTAWRPTSTRTRNGVTDRTAASYTFGLAAILVLIAWWQPFDVAIDVRVIAYKIRRLQRDAWQFTGLRDEGTAIVQSALFAAAACAALKARAVRHEGFTAILFGVAAIVALEAGQILISSRMPGLEDSVVGATGVILGAAWWSLRRRRSDRWWFTLLVAAVAAGAALQMLSPFAVAPSYRSIHWIPFRNFYDNSTMAATSHLIEQTLIYLPIGFCAVLMSSRRTRALAAAVAIVFLVAGSLELLQGWIVGRYSDITDLGLSVAGCWLGGRLADRGDGMPGDGELRNAADDRRPEQVGNA